MFSESNSPLARIAPILVNNSHVSLIPIEKNNSASFKRSPVSASINRITQGLLILFYNNYYKYFILIMYFTTQL